MQIDIKARNVEVSDEMRRHAEHRLAKVARQVSPLARVELEFSEERNPSIAEHAIVEGILHLKGATLRARGSSADMRRSLNIVADELERQVKRHGVKRRHRREQRRLAALEREQLREAPLPALPG